jgi:hypothetical protein
MNRVAQEKKSEEQMNRTEPHRLEAHGDFKHCRNYLCPPAFSG